MTREQQEFERFSWVIRAQHIVLAASVLILIATGLPLKYPHSSYARFVFSLTHGVHVSGVIHRIGAIGLIAVGVFHMLWLVLTRQGRANFRALLPRFQDLKDVLTNVLWYVGLSDKRARFGRFSYIEKFDYWAVYWGSVIMIGSGLVLWLVDRAMHFLPKAVVDVALEAHSDEALLATLAIFVWHFYNVHLNPDHFPMSTTWLTGTISKEDMLKHHPLDYEELQEKEREAQASPLSEKANGG